MATNRAAQMKRAAERIRRTFMGLARYNMGMQTKRQKDYREAWTVLGGFLGALLLSRVQLHGAHIPLAMGFLLGIELAGIESYGVLGGAVLGALVASPPLWQTMLTAVSFVASTRITAWLKKPCKTRFRLLLFAASYAISLPLLLLYGIEELLYGVFSMSIAAVFGFCVHRAIRSAKGFYEERLLTDAEQTCFALVIGAALLAMSEAQLFGWSLSVSLMLVLTAVYVSARGVFGASAGTLWASLLALYADADPTLLGAAALGALLGCAGRREGKPLIVAAFFAASLLFQSILSDAALSVNVQNLLCGMLLYLLIPRAWIERIAKMTDASVVSAYSMRSTIAQIEQGASDELMRMGRLLSGFSGMFGTVLQEDDAVQRWTVQGALNVCASCESQSRCWKDAEAMQETVLSLAIDADQERTAKPIANCQRMRELTASTLLAYRQAKSREAVCERVREQTGLVDRQFVGAGDALMRYAEHMRLRDRQTDAMVQRMRDAMTANGLDAAAVDRYETNGSEMLSITLRRPVRIKNGALQAALERACRFPLRLIRRDVLPDTATFVYERDAAFHASMRVFRSCDSVTVSGDATGECRMTGGHVCFALSDGMGSGNAARQESEAAIDLLFRLYRAGMQRELIYENVNRLLLARNDTEMYATLDAVSIDLNSGEAELLKYGAPPSYLVRNGRVKAISGEALPCGILAEAKPSVIRLRLKPNDRIVLCSDGVQDMLNDPPEQTIRSVANANEGMGELLLKLAESRGGSDDMTVMVIRVA